MFKVEKEVTEISVDEDIFIYGLTKKWHSPVNNSNLVSPIISTPGASVASECILRVDGVFFLIVELAVNSTIGTELSRVVVINISADLAARLLAGGIKLCTVQTTVPITAAGTGLSPACTFVAGNAAYIIFIVPNRTDSIVVVTSPLCTVI